MAFWKEQSANEIRAQLRLRYPDRYYKDKWPFKKKPELFEIIEELIKNKQWVMEDTTEKQGTALIESKDRASWAALTINNLKEQLKLRNVPWTGAKVKKDYLDIMYKTLGI